MELVQDILELVVAALGVIMAGIATYSAIKAAIDKAKAQTKEQNKQLLENMAWAAMIEAEQSLEDGDSKKQLVLDTVDAGAKAAGIDMSEFLEQISQFIDVTISKINKFTNKTE